MMPNNQELRKIERKAKALMLNKDIPRGKMDAVRSLIYNNTIDDRERYSTIIDIIANCPDKPPPKVTGRDTQQLKDKPIKEKVSPVRNETTSFTPTETAYYLDDLNSKYRYLKLFKKRYLAHRNNRLGIGFRKRLIPTQRLLKILKFIAESQEKILVRLTPLLIDILNDENIDNPTKFNYLRLFRKWMMDTPLVKYNIDSIKWMERINFEREFKDYIINFNSFLKLDPNTREGIIELVISKLRESEDLAKEEVDEIDTDHMRRGKEKRNLEKEKQIHEYILLLRSFLISRINDESFISVKLKKQYGIENFSGLLLKISEALIFQRPVAMKEINRYFEISAPVVNTERWDYNEETLKKIGKDPASKKRRELEKLKRRLKPYEELVEYLKAEKEGKSYIMYGVEKQWELVDRKRQNLENTYHDDFFAFLDGAIQFFRNAYLPLLDGTILYLRDPERNEIETAFFSETFLEDELSHLDKILNEMHLFKSNNPTLTMKHDEVKKIMMKQLKSLGNVEDYIRKIGDFFYRLAKILQEPFNIHRKWIFNGSPAVRIEKIRHPLEKKNINTISKGKGAPFPYYDCTIKDFYQNNQLTKRHTGSRFIDESGNDGLYFDILAFLYQAAHECYNDYLLIELDERKRLMRQIEEISR